MSICNLHRSQKQSGFTLIELLIVLAILGLFLGMLIPRLGGVVEDSVDTICDTNNKGIRYFTQVFNIKNGHLPNGLTNLVEYNEDNTEYALASIESNDIANKVEALSWSLVERNYLSTYHISQDEVSQLNDLGINTVYDLIGLDSSTNAVRPMLKNTLAENSTVAMMGLTVGKSSGTVEYPSITDLNVYDTTFKPGVETTIITGNIANPEWIGRIFMALNDQCELVKNGMIQASALCPASMLNKTGFTHKEYILVLPRLQATVDRMTGATSLLSGIKTTSDGSKYLFEEVLDDEAVAAGAAGRIIEVGFEAQEPWEFDVCCPEGHKWPDADKTMWKAVQESTGGSSSSGDGTGGGTGGTPGSGEGSSGGDDSGTGGSSGAGEGGADNNDYQLAA